MDQTLKIWDLDAGHTLATLQGHSAEVLACAVTPDGRRVVSASEDHTLKVWDLDSHACLFTHRANGGYTAVAATETTLIGGDDAGSVCFLSWPSSRRSATDGSSAAQPNIGTRSASESDGRNPGSV
jgi:WD40 repeat protein